MRKNLFVWGVIHICPKVPCPVTVKRELCRLSSFPVASQTDSQRVRQTAHPSCRPHGTMSACKTLPLLSEAMDILTLYVVNLMGAKLLQWHVRMTPFHYFQLFILDFIWL